MDRDVLADDDAGFDPFGAGRLRTARDAIASLLADDVVFVEPQASIRDASEVLRTSDVSLAVVGSHGDVVGVVSERDVVQAVASGLDLERTIVEVIETDELKWSTTDSSIDDVAEEMLENHLRHVLVRDDSGSLAGIVSMRDVLAAYLP